MSEGLPMVLPPDAMPERYYDLYCATGRMRLSDRAYAKQWYALGVPAEIAGAWARYGIRPEPGWRWMCDDWTPEMVGRLDNETRYG